MTEYHPTEYHERVETVPPFKARLTSYKLNNEYHCSADNVDPGAVIVRTTGQTREEAELKALMRAKERLEYSRLRYEKKI